MLTVIRIRTEAKQRINEFCCSRGTLFIYLYVFFIFDYSASLFLLSQTLLSFVSTNVKSKIAIAASQTLEKKSFDSNTILRVKRQENNIFNVSQCRLFTFCFWDVIL